MQRLPSHVVGPRLLLRSWEPEDARALSEAITASVAQLTPFLPWALEEPVSLPWRRRLIEGWLMRWESGGDSFLAMVRDGLIVGSAGLHRHGRADRVEIGYWVRTGETGNGYATEAASILTTAVFESTDIGVVAIHHDAANERSRRIPERLGFNLTREIRTDVEAPGQSGVEVQWEMERDQWVVS